MSNISRESFQKFCAAVFPTATRGFSFDVYPSFLSEDIFSDSSVEFCYQCWKKGWLNGFSEAVEGIEDNRIGIADKIDPNLLLKKIRDWG